MAPGQCWLSICVTLLDALRDHLHLPGTKKGWITASAVLALSWCRACASDSCLSLAVMHEGCRSRPSRVSAPAISCVHAVRVSGVRRLPVRILHAWANHVRRGASGGPVEHTDESIRENMSGNVFRAAPIRTLSRPFTMRWQATERCAHEHISIHARPNNALWRAAEGAARRVSQEEQALIEPDETRGGGSGGSHRYQRATAEPHRGDAQRGRADRRTGAQ